MIRFELNKELGFLHLRICRDGYALYCPYSQSYAECDAVNGVCWDFGIFFLPTDLEDHKGVGWDGGGGAQGFTQPAMRSTLIHFNCYLQNRKEKHKQEIQVIKVREVRIYSETSGLQVAKNRELFLGFSGLFLGS